MTGGGSANSKSSSSSIIPTAAAAPGETFHATPAKHSGGGSLDNFDLLKSSLPVLKQEPTSKEDSKNDHNTCANNSNTSNNPKSSPFSFRLADETSRRIDQILLRRSSSTPATTSPCTTTAGAIVSATATAERPSVHVQKHVYRRAAERLGLRIRKAKKNKHTTTPNESAMVKKRQATDTDTDFDNKHAMQNPMKKKRKTVTFRPTATLSTIERIAPSESEAMHRTSEESRRDRDRTIQNARDLRHLCQLYSHEDVGTIRSLAQCLQIDTCVRGVEHYLSQEVYEGRRRAALRVIDTVLQTQAQYQQRLNDHVSQQNGGQPGPTFVDAMTNDIALASASLSRGAAIDAMNRGAEDEAATKT